MVSVGIAMIARNGAQTIPSALAPFLGWVDEVSIVLGGKSRDKTAKVAKKFATVMSDYQGRLDDKGRLLNFAKARQQSFDQMKSDWAIVVDTDDTWHDVDTLKSSIGEAEQQSAPVIWFPYKVGNAFMRQPRCFRRDRGQWSGRVHEHFDFYSLENQPAMVMKPWISQPVKPPPGKDYHFIIIGEMVLDEEPGNLRAMAHLVQDYLASAQLGKAVDMARRYIDHWKPTEDGRTGDEELLMVLHNKGTAELHQKRIDAALLTAIQSLSVMPTGGGWSMLGEALVKLSTESSTALQDLAIFASDQALASGKPRHGFAASPSLFAETPCLIKALAQADKGQLREALHTVDLGLAIAPNHAGLNDLQIRLCTQLGEAP